MNSTFFDSSLNSDVTMLPEYWEEFFYPIDGGDMKIVNLSTFYKFGAAMNELNAIDADDKFFNPPLYQLMAKAGVWIIFFKGATNDLSFPHTRDIADSIRKMIEDFRNNVQEAYKKDDREATLGAAYVKALKELLDEFNVLFARESRKSNVFSVAPVGIYDTEKLIEAAEKRFPENLLKVMPQLTIDDLREAGKCLAFELPTACAFHVCRATEALMLAYYESLTGTTWAFPRRDWYNYNTQLASNGAPSAITNRLGELRDDRNAYAHPDIIVALDEAPVVFELCSGVIHLMAKEIEKIEAAKAAASSPPSTP